ncbi:MAG: alkaline phosphatase synthesis transcriptional regulatory protein [Bacteroidetes bacterium]|jgi:CheY-like chemotaxis protein|nr:alkaline phosphatase synthesis transcriptional regulatory protein [Bacteroidota bacterium]
MDILIVEDDKMTLNLLQYCIENLGHKAHLAADGDEAITMLQNGNYDLLICDVMMPGISGLSLVSVLRTGRHFTIPIILMSTLNNKPLLDAVAQAGADDFLPKPFSVEALTEKLKKYEKAANI